MQAVLLLIAAAQATPPPDVVTPREATWEELARDVFDPLWILPEDLPGARASAGGTSANLVQRMRQLLGTESSRAFGDAVRDVLRAGGGAAAIERVVTELTRSGLPSARELAPALRELCCTDRLRSSDWNPDRDDPCDGIWFASPLTLENEQRAPWSEIDGSKLVQQACVLVFADVETIKQAENDYRAYPRRPGNTYESIYPRRDKHLRGLDQRGNPFAALRIHFRCDLPFPFSDYRCDLAILNRTAWDGSLACDIYSESADFLWLAGRDTFLPVHASDGEWVGTAVVRWFGFDLKGVPDGDDARRAALRASLGSLKREAEALFRARDASRPRAIDGRVPQFDVRGGR